jgi:radical SAM protein with 4Fe4S-binding SPASM domain
MCGIARGGHLAVDVDGTLACCGVFAPSIQPAPTSALEASHKKLAVGNILDANLPESMATIHRRAMAHAIFEDKRGKHTSGGGCAACPYLRICAVCPRSIALIPGNEDPRRLPDFPCAFNRVRMKYRKRAMSSELPARVVQ